MRGLSCTSLIPELEVHGALLRYLPSLLSRLRFTVRKIYVLIVCLPFCFLHSNRVCILDRCHTPSQPTRVTHLSLFTHNFPLGRKLYSRANYYLPPLSRPIFEFTTHLCASRMHRTVKITSFRVPSSRQGAALNQSILSPTI
jgi:hypothetical protein